MVLLTLKRICSVIVAICWEFDNISILIFDLPVTLQTGYEKPSPKYANEEENY